MIENKLQTAVDWMATILETHIAEDILNEIKKQAKKIEKEHISFAYDSGFDGGWCTAKFNTMDEDIIFNSENFYNETYGQ